MKTGMKMIGAKVTEKEFHRVERMMISDMNFSKSDFIRKLINCEWERRKNSENKSQNSTIDELFERGNEVAREEGEG